MKSFYKSVFVKRS